MPTSTPKKLSKIKLAARCKVKATKDGCPKSHPYRGKRGPLRKCCFGRPLTRNGTAGRRSHRKLKAIRVCLPKADKHGVVHEYVRVKSKDGKTRCVQAGRRAARKAYGAKSASRHRACPTGQVAVRVRKVVPNPKRLTKSGTRARGRCCKNGAGPRTAKELAAQRKRCGPRPGENGHDPKKYVTCPTVAYTHCVKPRGAHKSRRASACKIGEALFTRRRTHTKGRFAGKTLVETRCINPKTSRIGGKTKNLSAQGWRRASNKVGKRPQPLLTHITASGHRGPGARKLGPHGRRVKAGHYVTTRPGVQRRLGKGTSRGRHANKTRRHNRVHRIGSKRVMRFSSKQRKAKKAYAARKMKAAKDALVAGANSVQNAAAVTNAAASKTQKAARVVKAKAPRVRKARGAKAAKGVTTAANAAVNKADQAKTANKRAREGAAAAKRLARKAKTPKGLAVARKALTRAARAANAGANIVQNAAGKVNAAANKVNAAAAAAAGVRRSARLSARR